MIAATLVNGICTSARLVEENYTALPGETLVPGEAIPSLQILSDPAAAAAAQSAVATNAQRLTDIDASLAAASFGVPPATLAQLKAMTRDQFNTWWSANVTNAAQAITVLKWIAWLVLRRL